MLGFSQGIGSNGYKIYMALRCLELCSMENKQHTSLTCMTYGNATRSRHCFLYIGSEYISATNFSCKFTLDYIAKVPFADNCVTIRGYTVIIANSELETMIV